MVFISRSEVLQKGVERLVSQALNEKESAFRDRIGDVVQTFVFGEHQQEPASRMKQEDGKEERKIAKPNESQTSGMDVSSHETRVDAPTVKTEQKLKTSDNPKAGRKGDDRAKIKTPQLKPGPWQAVANEVISKAPEEDRASVKRTAVISVALPGKDAADEECKPNSPSRQVCGGAVEAKSECKDHPLVRNDQKDIRCTKSCPLENSVDSLQEERKLVEEVATRNTDDADGGGKHDHGTASYSSAASEELVDAKASKLFVDGKACAGCADHPGLSKDIPAATEQDADNTANSDLTCSDARSDVSEVSSVHTSDLSSFDGQVSSDTEDEDQSDRIGDSAVGGTEKGNNDIDTLQGRPRRSTRMNSRRSTLEDEESRSGPIKGKAKEQAVSSKRGSDVVVKRKRGRPRKTDSGSSVQSGRYKSRQDRESKSVKGDGAQESDSEANDVARKRSQRRIKRTRCYSPSNEGTREVHLPSKRKRVHSKEWTAVFGFNSSSLRTDGMLYFIIWYSVCIPSVVRVDLVTLLRRPQYRCVGEQNSWSSSCRCYSAKTSHECFWVTCIIVVVYGCYCEINVLKERKIVA